MKRQYSIFDHPSTYTCMRSNTNLSIPLNFIACGRDCIVRFSGSSRSNGRRGYDRLSSRFGLLGVFGLASLCAWNLSLAIAVSKSLPILSTSAIKLPLQTVLATSRGSANPFTPKSPSWRVIPIRITLPAFKPRPGWTNQTKISVLSELDSGCWYAVLAFGHNGNRILPAVCSERRLTR